MLQFIHDLYYRFCVAKRRRGEVRAVAQELKKNGFRVKLADLDVQQGTMIYWHRRRLDNDFDPVGSVECFRTVREALEASPEYDAVIIDGAGRSSEATKMIADASHLVVQPAGASLEALSN